MNIRKAAIDELDKIMPLYDYARGFMREHGNLSQWTGGYPKRELIEETIRQQKCYVCEDNGRIAAVFYYAKEDDPTYHVIEDGAWLNDEPYAVVHRIVSAEGAKGVGSFCLNWAFEQTGNVRIDTHTDNKPMQGLLRKQGFTYCGRIYVEDGSPRIAFQKIRN